MPTLLRWGVVALATVHGLIHLMAAAVRFGWIEDPALGPGDDAGLWLAAAVLLLVTALLAAGGYTIWWATAFAGVAVSQVVILLSWSEASTGTLANIALLLAAGYTLASRGPGSFHAQWATGAKAALSTVSSAPPLVTEDDLDGLPEPLAAYVRRSRAVGRPRPESIEAQFRGRIRGDRNEPWLPFTGRQLSTFGPDPQRWFVMDATRSGMPVSILHRYVGGHASMRGKLLSVHTVLDASGPDMDRGETVTVFNDLVVLAPGAIPGAPVTWTQLDDHRVRGLYGNGSQTVTAELVFDAHHNLVDFVSNDRPRASMDGSTVTAQEWSTPSPRLRTRQGSRALSGSARWRDGDGWFTYIELEFDVIVDNPTDVRVRESVGRERTSV